ncbi:hypothetical protein V2I01_04980 [Micromonospora sp. BRA006-A]|nr:hypothetical protein [Micromonospora sp. BRA006-A]
MGSGSGISSRAAWMAANRATRCSQVMVGTRPGVESPENDQGLPVSWVVPWLGATTTKPPSPRVSASTRVNTLFGLRRRTLPDR